MHLLPCFQLLYMEQIEVIWSDSYTQQSLKTKRLFLNPFSTQYTAKSTYCHVERLVKYSCQILFQGPWGTFPTAARSRHVSLYFCLIPRIMLDLFIFPIYFQYFSLPIMWKVAERFPPLVLMVRILLLIFFFM